MLLSSASHGVRLQQSLGMNAIDMSHKWRMDRITNQLARTFRQFFGQFGGNRQAHVLELPHPAYAILRRHDQARPVRQIGATPVPQRALRDRQRSGWHRHLYGVRAVAGIPLVIRRRRGDRTLPATMQMLVPSTRARPAQLSLASACPPRQTNCFSFCNLKATAGQANSQVGLGSRTVVTDYSRKG